MRFDVVIGNPPYQGEIKGYGRAASPLYNLFIDWSKQLNPKYLTMIIPSRWFTGGKNLDDFRDSMLKDLRIRSLDDFVNARDIFPDVNINGGVCYFLWDSSYKGPCKISVNYGGLKFKGSIRPLKEKGLDTYIRYSEGLDILKKVVSVESNNSLELALPKDVQFYSLVSPCGVFNFPTTTKGNRTKENIKDLKIFVKGGFGFIKKDQITRGHEYLDKWKVFTGCAGSGHNTLPNPVLCKPFIGEPGSLCTDTYLLIGPFESKEYAESVLSYLSCKLTRFLIFLSKCSQHMRRKVYSFVPLQTWDRVWTDEELYKKYALSKEEVAFIEKMIKPMEVDFNLQDA